MSQDTETTKKANASPSTGRLSPQAAPSTSPTGLSPREFYENVRTPRGGTRGATADGDLVYRPARALPHIGSTDDTPASRPRRYACRYFQAGRRPRSATRCNRPQTPRDPHEVLGAPCKLTPWLCSNSGGTSRTTPRDLGVLPLRSLFTSNIVLSSSATSNFVLQYWM